tara:strand:- start:885 stop:1406 length:522 start_codon:yes stop_codon:yes gene_type:complete
MQKKIIKFTIFIFITFLMGVFFIGLSKDTFYSTKDLVGKKITGIELITLNEEKIFTEIDIKKDKFILINFWASWCGPCKIEHPILLKLRGEKNLRLLGVNFKDKKDNALLFLSKLGNPYNNLFYDKIGKSAVNFGIYGIPESILLDKNLVVIKKFIGPLSNSDFEYIKGVIKK